MGQEVLNSLGIKETESALSSKYVYPYKESVSSSSFLTHTVLANMGIGIQKRENK